jgi:hypothetical protein
MPEVNRNHASLDECAARNSQIPASGLKTAQLPPEAATSANAPAGMLASASLSHANREKVENLALLRTLPPIGTYLPRCAPMRCVNSGMLPQNGL